MTGLVDECSISHLLCTYELTRQWRPYKDCTGLCPTWDCCNLLLWHKGYVCSTRSNGCIQWSFKQAMQLAQPFPRVSISGRQNDWMHSTMSGIGWWWCTNLDIWSIHTQTCANPTDLYHRAFNTNWPDAHWPWFRWVDRVQYAPVHRPWTVTLAHLGMLVEHDALSPDTRMVMFIMNTEQMVKSTDALSMLKSNQTKDSRRFVPKRNVQPLSMIRTLYKAFTLPSDICWAKKNEFESSFAIQLKLGEQKEKNAMDLTCKSIGRYHYRTKLNHYDGESITDWSINQSNRTEALLFINHQLEEAIFCAPMSEFNWFVFELAPFLARSHSFSLLK